VGSDKVNVDAAVSKNSATGAIAAVARSREGTFLGASAVVLRGVTDPETLEAMACREGLNLAADLLLRRITVASDCLNLVRSIGGEGKGSYGHIVREIKASVDDFQQVRFVHERRTANIDAHTLARGSVSRDVGRHVWFQFPPEGVCTTYNVI
jgi:ribonuclease HI